MKLRDFGIAILIGLLLTWGVLLQWAPSQKTFAEVELEEALEADA